MIRIRLFAASQPEGENSHTSKNGQQRKTLGLKPRSSLNVTGSGSQERCCNEDGRKDGDYRKSQDEALAGLAGLPGRTGCGTGFTYAGL